MQVIGVVGSGAMGAGIAQVALTAGLEVILYDLDQAALQRACGEIGARLRRLVEKGQLGEAEAADAMDSLVLATDLSNLAPAEAVIEAIVERLEPKQTLFAKLEELVSPEAILATNTSSLSVAQIAARCRHPERVCGLHFFNPVPLMKLVEVIAAPATSDAVAERATALARQFGKTAVQVRDGPGFLVNLAGRAYVTEALQIVQEGVADVATVDRIMRDGAGFRMGPFELMDLTGIDVNFPATTTIYQGYQHDPRLRTTTLHEAMFNAGRFGRKTGRGFHEYGEGVAAAAEVAPEAAPGPFAARIAGGDEGPGWAALRGAGLQDGGDLALVAPDGEDATAVCHWLSLDPAKTVAIDFTGLERKHLTLMTAPGGGDAAARAATWLRGRGYRVETVRDSPGFVLQRILATIANLGCELAQIGVGAPADIDTAMRLAQNYPKGPLEWAEHLGTRRVHEILRNLQSITGSDRYRPSLWLRRRALLGLPIHAAD